MVGSSGCHDLLPVLEVDRSLHARDLQRRPHSLLGEGDAERRVRHHLIGLKLLAAAEEKARELKSLGLLVSAPFGGNLWELLPRCRYVETNRVFFKKVA